MKYLVNTTSTQVTKESVEICKISQLSMERMEDSASPKRVGRRINSLNSHMDFMFHTNMKSLSSRVANEYVWSTSADNELPIKPVSAVETWMAPSCQLCIYTVEALDYIKTLAIGTKIASRVETCLLTLINFTLQVAELFYIQFSYQDLKKLSISFSHIFHRIVT